MNVRLYHAVVVTDNIRTVVQTKASYTGAIENNKLGRFVYGRSKVTGGEIVIRGTQKECEEYCKKNR